jgi:type IV pilus assembly protein PilA
MAQGRLEVAEVTRDEPLAVGEEDGFSMVELLVVLVILAILIAIVVPTFLSARAKAADRATQTNIRNAFVADKIFFVDKQAYTDSPAALANVEPTIPFIQVGTPDTVGQVNLYAPAPSDTLVLGALSRSGTCFYLKADPKGVHFGSGACSDITSPVLVASITGDSW